MSLRVYAEDSSVSVNHIEVSKGRFDGLSFVGRAWDNSISMSPTIMSPPDRYPIKLLAMRYPAGFGLKIMVI